MSTPRIDERFDAVSARFPDRIAVVAGAETVTYQRLRERADGLAGRLVECGAGAGTLIGLACRPGVDLIVGILAILKAGGCYLALDPAYPDARIGYLLRDAAPRIVLAEPGMAERVAGRGATVVGLDERAAPRPNEATSADPAYVIYTSGSTGDPKGVVVEHRQVTRLFEATRHWFGFTERDVWTLFHSASFDFSVWEIWGALLHGGRLVVVPPLARRHPGALLRVLTEQGVTVLNQTPSAFRNLRVVLDEGAEAIPGSLRLVVFGGERLDVAATAPFLIDHPGVELVNMYGITETTVHVTYRRITTADLADPAASPIGAPIPDLSVDLRDAEGTLVPDGAPGEMWISGAGLARGYLNRPDLTARRFVTDSRGRRAYRSGDRAVRRAGELVYLGRVDDQLKVNGFRIEPGEIEAVLRAHPGITDVVVTAAPDHNGGTELVAVVAADTGIADELRAHVAARLPAHLRPSRYCPVARLDLTANGKLDRAAAARIAAHDLVGPNPQTW